MAIIPTALTQPAVGDLTDTAWADNVALWVALLAKLPRARAYSQASQNVVSATQVLATLGQAEYDTDGMWSASAPNQLTVRTAGMYAVMTHASFAANGTGSRAVWCQKNGIDTDDITRVAPPSGAVCALSCMTLVSCAVGDVLTVLIFQESGTTLATQSSPDRRYQVRLTAAMIGAA